MFGFDDEQPHGIEINIDEDGNEVETKVFSPQDVLYNDYLSNKDDEYVECRLPIQFEVWDSDTRDWALDKSEEDKYKSQKLIGTAKQLLQESDYRMLFDRYDQYTPKQQVAIVTYRAQLRAIVRGESTEIPELSFTA